MERPSPPARPPAPFVAFDGVLADRVAPASFPALTLRFRNQRWAERVGLGDLDALAWARHFGGFDPLPGNLDAPRAMRYHGHQFGVYNPDLGDGRGFLFAQLRDDRGRLLDLGTKGSGKTPWSRGGDGRLTLKGGVREILATELLEALGVETSKSFSLFETGERLMRGDEPSPTRSSVLVRLSHGHVRFGTFQRLADEGDAATMTRLVDHVVEHYYPHLASEADVPRALVSAITEKMARLAAAYTVAGFVHGVLNTDNMNVTGESFDYGPWRFLPELDPAFTAAYFDHAGRYAFGRQADTLVWNLMRLCDALRLVAKSSALASAAHGFAAHHAIALGDRMCFRLGVKRGDPDLDAHLAETVLTFLREHRVSFDGFFFDWARGPASEDRAARGPRAAVYAGAQFTPVRRVLEAYTPRCDGFAPYHDRDAPVSLVHDVVERTWEKIAVRDAWAPFDRLVADIRALGATLACGDAPADP